MKRRKYLRSLHILIKEYGSKNVAYLDESGIDEFLKRDYARAELGKQIISDVYGRKYGRISIIVAWLPQAKEMIAPYVFDEYTDAKRFNGWIKKCLLPEP